MCDLSERICCSTVECNWSIGVSGNAVRCSIRGADEDWKRVENEGERVLRIERRGEDESELLSRVDKKRDPRIEPDPRIEDSIVGGVIDDDSKKMGEGERLKGERGGVEEFRPSEV